MTIRDMVPFNRRRQRGSVAPARRGEHPLGRLHEELDRMFEDFMPAMRGQTGLPGWEDFEEYLPSVDVKETDNEIKVTAELPGMDEKDIDVRVEDDTLIITGEKSQENEDRDGDTYHSERYYGSFTRAVPLNAEVDIDNADASYKKGVLRLNLPKTGSDKGEGKKIPVKGE